MKDLPIKLSVKWDLLKDERGQDLMEYALLIAFMSFAATAAMTTLAGVIDSTFTAMGGDLIGAI
jgi:Flp pilus assembly pilin Flp